MKPDIDIKPGHALPFGATITEKGVQFSVFSRHATDVCLLLFDHEDDADPAHRICLNPKTNRTGDCWHVLVEGIGEGQLYLYTVDGPYAPEVGHRFNRHRALIDPYAKALSGPAPWSLRRALGYIPGHPDGDLSYSTDVDMEGIPKCVVVDDTFDWQGDRPLNYPLRETVIYETHVKGLTNHPAAVDRYGIRNPGTYAGVIEMIPHLKDLGITSLEFLPISEFDEYEYADRMMPETGRPMTNYWGYSSIAFMAPKGSYASAADGPGRVREFKTMVRELHRAGIEVILDIVFNHTGEGDQRGPTFSFRGFDNSIYYILAPDNRYYRNYSGCGNTMNCNHPVVRSLIIDCLRYWVQDMHVDGFRFDLGSILGRDAQGRILDNPPVLERIAEDPVLRDTKIIAEAWDAGGAYQVGSFPGGRWAEWNDRFRDEVRGFWKGDPGHTSAFATRVSGSSDLYSHTGRKPYHSINYVTAHDGFTLSDLVSYDRKHNEANGEENRDGTDFNLSRNWGAEGETDDAAVEALRTRMVKNFWATLLLSSGTPMILGGDEFRRTQYGNNNAYAQDNEISWYDFRRMDIYPEVFRFAALIIEFRKNHPALQRREFYVGRDLSGNQVSDISWFDENGNPMDWERPENIIALRIDGSRREIHHSEDDADILMFFNASGKDVRFPVPEPQDGYKWHRVANTALSSPEDIVEAGKEVPLPSGEGYDVASRSMALFIGLES